MCRTTQSKRRGLPGEFFRRPVRWVMARGPDGWLARSLSISSVCGQSQRRIASSRSCTLPGPNRKSSPGSPCSFRWPVCQCVRVLAKSHASINGVLASAPNNNGTFCVDGNTAPPHGRLVRLRGPQIDGPDHPVGTSGISEDRRRAGIDLLQQHQVWASSRSRSPCPFAALRLRLCRFHETTRTCLSFSSL